MNQQDCERIGPAGVAVKRVDSGQELADGLTKCWKHEQLIHVLSLGCWKIVYDPLFLINARRSWLKEFLLCLMLFRFFTLWMNPES